MVKAVHKGLYINKTRHYIGWIFAKLFNTRSPVLYTGNTGLNPYPAHDLFVSNRF